MVETPVLLFAWYSWHILIGNKQQGEIRFLNQYPDTILASK